MSAVPWGDWQFWLVTIAAVGGAVLIARALLPGRRKPPRTKLTVSAPRSDESR